MEGREVTWEELAKEPIREVPYLINPYVPESGTVFLYGDTSIGKSPLSWHIAKAIGAGPNFFGLPVRRGKVLYVELDTPDIAVVPRLQKLDAAPGVTFFFHHGNLNAPNMEIELVQQLQNIYTRLRPDAVIFNTLVKAHDMDDKDTKTPSKVYGFFRALFPQSANIFIHHIRKADRNPQVQEIAKEAFSGSKHWIDDATVGLFLQPYKGKDSGDLRLYHVKSQVSQKLNPMPLKLDEDGSHLTSPLYESLVLTYEMVNEWEAEKGAKDRHGLDMAIAARLGVSVDTARRRRYLIEQRKFPGSPAFLEREKKDEKDADAAAH